MNERIEHGQQGHIETIRRTAYTSDGRAMWQLQKDIYPVVKGKESLAPYNALMREVIMKHNPPPAMNIPLPNLWAGDESLFVRFIHSDDASGKRLSIIADTEDRKLACVEVLMVAAERATQHFSTLMNELEKQLAGVQVAAVFAADLKLRGFC